MVKAAVVASRALVNRLELTGVVEPTNVARMGSPAQGPIVACTVREGDHVEAGQLLARLGRARGDDATARAARVRLEGEQVELERIERLVETGAIPSEELDAARVGVSEARARLVMAMEKLGDYRIAAPWAGIVSKVHVTVGDFVAARESLVELFDPNSLVLRAAVPENASVLVSEATKVGVTLEAYPERSFDGRVTRIYPEIDRRSFTRTIEVELDDEELDLVPGMFARLEMILSSVSGAVSVPVAALLHHDETAPAVFVISPGPKVTRRQVKTGIEDSGWVQITAGLEPGEKVAVAGQGRLRDGVKVRLAGRKAGKAGKGPGKTGTKRGVGKASSRPNR